MEMEKADLQKTDVALADMEEAMSTNEGILSLHDYQERFDRPEASMKNRIAVLNAVNQNLNLKRKERFLFFNKNCAKLPGMIVSYDQAVNLYLFFNLCGCQKIWATVTALKAIKIWLKNKEIEEISLNFRIDLVEVFSAVLSSGTVEKIVAEDIIKKLEI